MRQSGAQEAPRAARRSFLTRPLLLSLVLGAMVVGTWAYAVSLWQPIYRANGTAGGATFGPYFVDFYQIWEGTHARLWRGLDPYSPTVTAAIQQGFYGRVLAPDDPWSIPESFSYPLYTVFLVAPFTLAPFSVVMPFATFGMAALLALSVAGWRIALGWALPGLAGAWLMLLGASHIPEISVVFLQQPSGITIVCMAGAGATLYAGAQASSAAARQRRYALAGALLALATIKPQLCLVLILWLLGWSLVDWRGRWGLPVGFAGAMLSLVGGAWLLQPGWVGQWLAVLQEYQTYGTGQTLLVVLIPPELIPVAQAGLGLALAGLAWATRRAGPGSLGWSVVLAGCGLYSLILYPSWAVYNQVILFPAMLLVLQQRIVLRGLGLPGRLSAALAVDTLLWPLVTAPLVWLTWLGAALVGGPSLAAQAAQLWAVPWITSFIIPLALFPSLLLLSWHALRAGPAAESR